MVNSKFYFLSIITCALLLYSCSGGKTPVMDVRSPRILDDNEQQLTQVIIYDVFSAPVASRIYAYTSLASYEAIRFAKPGYASIAAGLNGFPPMPQPDSTLHYDFTLAASSAFFTVAHKVVFSVDTLQQYEKKLYNSFRSVLDEDTYERSFGFGQKVGEQILKRIGADNYKKTRGMAKYLGSKEDGKWQPTSPDYLEGVEPYWGQILPLALDSASQIGCPRPPVFSKADTSTFYISALEVYNIGRQLSDSQITIIKYWDDNPFVMEHKGHLMFANKKITPGGHWMGIASIACRKAKADLVKTAQVHALTAIALMDGFIACWQEKYKTEVVRPITVIQQLIDDKWEPYLQTPPFPEYPSGHSVISAAAATVLTEMFGDGFSFHDDSDKAYIGMERDFSSFMQAANEAAISRVYGGIHFRSAMDAGAEQGRRVGKFIVDKLLKSTDAGTDKHKNLQASAAE